MNALSEYLLPLVFVVAFVLISIRKGSDKKKQEEMAKTMLPGRKSGEVLAVPAPAPVPVARSRRAAQKLQGTASKPLWDPTDVPVKPSAPVLKEDNEEDFHEPVLDIEDVDNMKKAVIYAEILNRKDY